MRASHAGLGFLAFLPAAGAAWHFRRSGDEAELAAAGLGAIAVAGAAATLLRRRVVAGLCALTAGAGVWAATGGGGVWLAAAARWAVGAPLGLALVVLVVATGSRATAEAARRR
jgi:hypothetical protein